MKITRILIVFLSVCMVFMCMAGMSVSASADYLNVTLLDKADLEGVETVSELADKLGITSIGEYNANSQTLVPSDEKLYLIYGINEEENQVLGRIFEYGELNEGFSADLTIMGLDVYMDDGFTVCYVSKNDFNAYDLTNAFVDANTYDHEVNVIMGEEVVPESEYHVIYFTWEEIEGGESLTRVGTDFPTEPGTYIAAVVANEGSEYTGENRSEPFEVFETFGNDISNGDVWVDVYEQTVTVELNGEEVPESEYHVIFFAREEIEGGESLTRVGTDFPTEPGTYIAAVVANDGSEYIGENRSDPFSVFIVNENDISYGEVWVDVYEQTVTVELNGEEVPESEYHVIYFAWEEIEGGESLERVGTDFPTEPGTYIAAVVANEGSEYSGENRSDPFTVESGSEADLSNSIVYVDVGSKNVTVRLDGGLVSEENYHVIFFTREETEGGESLTRVGTDFPTEPGTYIAAIVANEGSDFTGENRSDPFTIEASQSGGSVDTGSSFGGAGLIAAIAGGVVVVGGGIAAGIAVSRKKKKGE